MEELSAEVGARDVELRIAGPLLDWLIEQRGEVVLNDLAKACQIPPAELERKAGWVSYESFNELLSQARRMMPDEETFRTACTHNLVNAYGVLRFITWAVNPGLVFEQVARSVGTISKIHMVEIVSRDRTHLVGRWTCQKPETRLACISRMAQAAAIPRWWGLPAAEVEETACAARGDPYCEYAMRWYEPARALPVIVGGALGGLLSLAGHAVGLGALALSPAMVVLGALFTYSRELRRTSRRHLEQSQEIHRALREIAIQEAEARRELSSLQERQSRWSAVVEAELDRRTHKLEDIISELQRAQEERAKTLRAFSHDLRNPLTSLKFESEILRQLLPAGERDGLLTLHEQAVDSMENLLRELLRLSQSSVDMLAVSAQQIDVERLADDIRRRLKALVFGRDVVASAFATRSTPRTIFADRLILDRIVDNLLTNAAKYTERGSIVVELSGAGDGGLTLSISDSGRGISAADMARIFRPGGSPAESRARDSHGLGLSIVVRLLDLVGGNLDVVSQVGSGTTFCVHLPQEMKNQKKLSQASGEETYDQVVDRIVTVRKVLGP